MCPETRWAPSLAMASPWRGRGIDSPIASALTSQQVKLKAQSKAAEQVSRPTEEETLRLRRVGWPKGSCQEQRKPRSDWGKCQGRFCFDSSCNCSASFSLWLPPPTFSLPSATCRGLEVPGGFSQCFQQPLCLTVVASDCLCAQVLRAQDYHMPFKHHTWWMHKTRDEQNCSLIMTVWE